MQLTLHNDSGSNLIRAVEPGILWIDDQSYSTSLLVLPDSIEPWSIRAVNELNAAAATELLQLQPDLIVFGSGTTQQFPSPDVLRSFRRAGMGFEVMDTLAACRTYNVLVSEGRRVLGALIRT